MTVKETQTLERNVKLNKILKATACDWIIFSYIYLKKFLSRFLNKFFFQFRYFE